MLWPRRECEERWWRLWWPWLPWLLLFCDDMGIGTIEGTTAGDDDRDELKDGDCDCDCDCDCDDGAAAVRQVGIGTGTLLWLLSLWSSCSSEPDSESVSECTTCMAVVWLAMSSVASDDPFAEEDDEEDDEDGSAAIEAFEETDARADAASLAFMASSSALEMRPRLRLPPTYWIASSDSSSSLTGRGTFTIGTATPLTVTVVVVVVVAAPAAPTPSPAAD